MHALVGQGERQTWGAPALFSPSPVLSSSFPSLSLSQPPHLCSIFSHSPFFSPPLSILSATVWSRDSSDRNALVLQWCWIKSFHTCNRRWNFEFGLFPGLAECSSIHSLHAGQRAVSHGTQSAIATRGNKPLSIVHHVSRLQVREARCIRCLFGLYVQRQRDGLALLRRYVYLLWHQGLPGTRTLVPTGPGPPEQDAHGSAHFPELLAVS